MKYLFSLIIILFWIISTLILAISLVGLVFMIDDESYWWQIPNKAFEILK